MQHLPTQQIVTNEIGVLQMKQPQERQHPVSLSRKPGHREVTWAALSLLVIGFIHYLAIFLIATHRQEAVSSAMTQYLFNSSIVVHVISGTLFVLFALLVRSGRNWLRILITVLLVIQLLAHLSLPTLMALLPSEAVFTLTVQAVSLLFELAALFLLWFSRPVRLYFAAGKVGTGHAGG
jgi:hypothetical protein